MGVDPSTATAQKDWFLFDNFSDLQKMFTFFILYFCIILLLFLIFYFPVDEYEEECVPSGGFAYEKVSKNFIPIYAHLCRHPVFPSTIRERACIK